jgi:hypothetical protein
MLLNHHPDDSYPTNEVQNVAEFLLSTTSPNTPSSPAGYSSSVAITKAVKQELVDIAYLIREMMKTEVLKLVMMALADHQRTPPLLDATDATSVEKRTAGSRTARLLKNTDWTARSHALPMVTSPYHPETSFPA